MTDRRANGDFAQFMRDLVDLPLLKGRANSSRARQSLDASTRRTNETFEPEETRRILQRLDFHNTPKHASWLNRVEIEIGVMVKQSDPIESLLKKPTESILG